MSCIYSNYDAHMTCLQLSQHREHSATIIHNNSAFIFRVNLRRASRRLASILALRSLTRCYCFGSAKRVLGLSSSWTKWLPQMTGRLGKLVARNAPCDTGFKLLLGPVSRTFRRAPHRAAPSWYPMIGSQELHCLPHHRIPHRTPHGAGSWGRSPLPTEPYKGI